MTKGIVHELQEWRLIARIVLVQREMEFGLGSLSGNDGTTGFALGGRC